MDEDIKGFSLSPSQHFKLQAAKYVITNGVDKEDDLGIFLLGRDNFVLGWLGLTVEEADRFGRLLIEEAALIKKERHEA
jgi:hypothetical protein